MNDLTKVETIGALITEFTQDVVDIQNKPYLATALKCSVYKWAIKNNPSITRNDVDGQVNDMFRFQ